MKPGKTSINLIIDKAIKQKLLELAEADRRTMTLELEHLIEQAFDRRFPRGVSVVSSADDAAARRQEMDRQANENKMLAFSREARLMRLMEDQK